MNLEETLLFYEQPKKKTLISDFETTLNLGICTINQFKESNKLFKN